MSRDDYLILLHDMMAKRNALDTAINSVRLALDLGAITDDPRTKGSKPVELPK